MELHSIKFCRCFERKKNCKKDFNKELIKRFENIYEFCNKDINKFILLFRKGVYPYEYMDSWERFDETSLPDKEAFYSGLNMQNTTDVDYRHANKVFKEFRLKNLGDYHDLYVQSDTLLLADVFENFRNKCIEVYELDPAHFLSAFGLEWQACLKKTEVKLELLTNIDMLLMTEIGIRGGICHAIHSIEVYELDPAHFLSAFGLEWQACLKKTEVKLELLTNIDMLLMTEIGIRGGICHAIHRYAEANNKCMKNYDKNKESSFIEYLDANNLYGWAMSQKLLVDGFKWKKIC